MARRRGNKTRRDVERDSTTFRRIAKIGVAAASITAGGYTFMRSDYGKQLMKSGVINEVLSTGKNIRNDMLNKPKDLRTLKYAYDRNIGKNAEVFKENLKKRAIEGAKQATDSMTEKTLKASDTSLVKKMTHVLQTHAMTMSSMKQEEQQQLKRKLKEHLSSGLDDDKKAKLGDIVDALYNEVTQENINIKGPDDKVSPIVMSHYKTARKSGFSDEQLDNILQSMVKWKEENIIDNQYIQDKYGDFAEKLYQTRRNTLFRTNKYDETKRSFFDKVVDTATDSKPLTVGDLQDFKNLDFGNRIFVNKEGGLEAFDVTADLYSMAQDGRYNNLIVDRGLRVTVDETGKKILTDHRDTVNAMTNWFDKAKETLPGKILLKNIDLGDKHSFNFLLSDKLDVNAYLTGATDNVMQHAMVRIDDSVYGIGVDAAGKAYLDEGNKAKVREVTAWRQKVTQELLGTRQQPLETYDGALAQIFDINQDGSFNLGKHTERFFDNVLAEKLHFNMQPDWEKNQLRNIKDYMNNSYYFADAVNKSRMYDSAMTTSIILNRNITGVSDELMQNLINSDLFEKEEVKILQYLLDGSPESINSAIYELGHEMADASRGIGNDRLSTMIYSTFANLEKTSDIEHISIKEGRHNFLFGTAIDEVWTRDMVGQMRVEYVKELMTRRVGVHGAGDYIRILNTVTDNELQHKALRDIGMLGIFEQYMNLDGRITSDIMSRFERVGSENTFRHIIQSDFDLMSAFNNIMDEAISDFSPMNKSYLGGINELGLYSEYNDVTLIRKSKFNVKDILTDINESLRSGDYNKMKGSLKNTIDATMGLGKELLAGRYDTENITEATLLAQYSMSRLNYSLAEFGLNLSADSMSSPLATYLNFGLKRILPAAAAIGTFNYLNDESRRFTGTSITEAAARGMSYVDIAARKVAYNVSFPVVGNIGQQLDNLFETSVIHEYWFGSQNFDTAEERREWYENGYSPVRKGRFWSFGSSSEFRGGAISYWQPNYLRRAESNYHDISVYGSSEEKWAHSWIPTPTHPFSTVRAALNPYWLEKKHLKEGDRPYPMSAKMFDEGTAWGAVLNPTVGEILKPVRMMPEARLRLGSNGRDSKAVINRINERLKHKERHKDDQYSNEDLIFVSGSDIRNAEYVPYGNPVAGEMHFQVRDGQIVSPGVSFMNEEVPLMSEYAPPTGDDYAVRMQSGDYKLITSNYSAYAQVNPRILDGMTNYNANGTTERLGRSLIESINNSIKEHRRGDMPIRTVGTINDTSNSTYIHRNLVNEYNHYLDDWYGERFDPAMIDQSRMADYGRDMAHSAQQVGGMYGYLYSVATGAGDSYTFRYENAGEMTSFGRGFWDASVGGLGAGPMEIARRFFPSQDKNRINVNPLVNNMPDWIPDSYKTGDPYIQIPKGEMRLPGKGYEAMYDLYPDQFGDYGAFDRYKILADIAPNSPEYKKWRNIAKATVKDPELVEEMKDIAERTSKMNGKHEFFDYTYVNNNTEYVKGIAMEVAGNQIRLADNTMISLAGVLPTDQTSQALTSLIQPGQEITYRREKDAAYDKDETWKNHVAPAVVYIPKQSTSINKMLIDQGAAEKDVEDHSVLSKLGQINPGQEASGAVQEILAHAPIPIVHNKFLKVENAYESYMNETFYGSSFKTWDHPIEAYVKPMLNQQTGKSMLNEAISLAIANKHFKDWAYSGNKQERWMANALLVTTNPAAFLGGNIAYLLKMGIGGDGKGQELNNWQTGAKWGTMFSAAKYAWDNADNPFKSMTYMAYVGAQIASKDLGWELLEKTVVGKMSTGKGAAIGAGIGFAMSALKNPSFDKEKMFGKWTPKKTRKKWELDEYFDRLEYMKYSGLYERAAAMARRKEKIDIKGIFEQIDKNKEKIAKINRKAAKVAEKVHNPNDRHAHKLAQLENRKRLLEEQNQMMFKGGEWTKSAIAYKKAMESTMYGINATATKDELLAAVPEQYKDHFQAFMNVTDKKERKKILRSVSPMMRRPLQAAWGMELEKVQSNRKYFKIHALPGLGWRGWRPNVQLKHVKMKTVENEGMLLSDFGYYDSEKAKVTFESAPDIENYDAGSRHIFHAATIRAILKGHGLHLHNISIEKTRAPGIKVVGDIKEKAEDYKDAGSYGVSKIAYKLGSLF